jgi:hypothetical protein
MSHESYAQTTPPINPHEGAWSFSTYHKPFRQTKPPISLHDLAWSFSTYDEKLTPLENIHNLLAEMINPNARMQLVGTFVDLLNDSDFELVEQEFLKIQLETPHC